MDNSPLFDTIFHYMQHFKTEPEDEYKKLYDETRVLDSMYFNDIINNYMNIPNFREPTKYDKGTYYYPKKITNPNSSNYTIFFNCTMAYLFQIRNRAESRCKTSSTRYDSISI